jgi:hypothetical protein
LVSACLAQAVAARRHVRHMMVVMTMMMAVNLHLSLTLEQMMFPVK